MKSFNIHTLLMVSTGISLLVESAASPDARYVTTGREEALPPIPSSFEHSDLNTVDEEGHRVS